MIRSLAVSAGLIAAGMLAFAAPAHAQRGGYSGQSEQVRCESRDYRYQRCDVNWRDAQIVRQASSTPCRRGDTWGIDRRGLWVDRGCAGVFVEAGGRPGRPGHAGPGPGGPGNNWNRDIRFTCESPDYRYKMCQVDTGPRGQVRIERQISKTRCVMGQTWGFHRGGVWVNQGCSAVFVVERR